MTDVTDELFQRHRMVATQVAALYTEIDKLAKKRAGDSTTALMAKKINHVIKAVRDLVAWDDFLDAVESVPVSGNMVRMDEALIVLAELKSALARQWDGDDFTDYRGKTSQRHVRQIMS